MGLQLLGLLGRQGKADLAQAGDFQAGKMAGKLPLLQNDPAQLIFLSSLRSWSAAVLMSSSLMRGLFRPMDMMKYYQVVRTFGPHSRESRSKPKCFG